MIYLSNFQISFYLKNKERQNHIKKIVFVFCRLSEQNIPNPFRTLTMIYYSVPRSGMVTLKIYDMLGREVKTLFREYQEAENYSFNFNAGNLPCVVYFVRLQGKYFVKSKKILIIQKNK